MLIYISIYTYVYIYMYTYIYIYINIHGGTRGRYRHEGNPAANLKSISARCYLQEVTFEWKVTR